MNVEELRDYCLSLGADVEEKMPFQAFKAARGVLAFYVCGHMFCYFDIDRFSTVSLKCRPEDIDDLKERSRNKTMARVGERLRVEYDHLQQQLGEDNVALVWEQGGHFNDPSGRVARAFRWCLSHFA